MEAADGETDAATEVQVVWRGEKYGVPVLLDDTVADFKRRLGEMTRVLPMRQKLMGLKDLAGKPAADAVCISDLRPVKQVMMVGAPEDVVEAVQAEAGGAVVPDVVDDLEGPGGGMAALEPENDPAVQERLERRLRMYTVETLHPPRRGVKLLVVDIDYTIFDLGSSAEAPMELARPHLHAFFAAAYPLYDIAIWSANSLKWMNVKMRALGVLDHPEYRVTFMLDFRAMLTVHTEKYGAFDCKPLAFIWRKFDEWYSPHMTVMLDDLRRNFIMNKQNGLVVRPFVKAHRTRATDRELVRLKHYLSLIGTLGSFEYLNHRRWERYLTQNMSTEQASELERDLTDP